MTRRRADGSEMVSAVLVLPVLVAFLFGLVSLNVGAFQRQLLEYGASHATDRLDPGLAELPQRERDEALRSAILSAVPLLGSTEGALEVRDTQVEVVRHATSARLWGDGYGHAGLPWASADVGHVDLVELRVRATVSTNAPPLLGSWAWHAGGDSDRYEIRLDRSYVLQRREEVW